MAKSSHFWPAFLAFMCMTAAVCAPQEPSQFELAPAPYPTPLPSTASPTSPPIPLPPRPLGEDPDKFQLSLEVMWDGVVTARDPETNEVRWSFSSGNPLNSAHCIVPDSLEGGTNSSIGIPGESHLSEDEFLFCGSDWRLYAFDKKHGIEVLPIPPHKLVQDTPVVLSDAIILGTMTTSVFVVDAKSGSLVQTFDSRNESFAADSFREEDLWRFLEPTFDERRDVDYLFVFRKDYTIKSVEMASGNLLWNVSLADVRLHQFESNGILQLPGAGESGLKDHLSPQSVPFPVALPAGHEGYGQFSPDVVQDEYLIEQHNVVLQQVLLDLIPSREKIIGAVSTLVCILAGVLVWKITSWKRSEEGRQVAKRRKSRKARAGTLVTPQEPAQANNSSTLEHIVGPHSHSNAVPSNEANCEKTTIGVLRVLTSRHIGFGSNGTMVFEGFLGDRPVAVKRMLTQYYDKAQKEVSLLIKSDAHPNILRYHLVTYDAHFVYVALERCQFSLNDLVLAQRVKHCLRNNGNDCMPCDISKEELCAILQKTGDAGDFQLWDDLDRPCAKLMQLMRDILEGLAHLHSMGIVHRDLKPHNVLISFGDMPRAKLSDMGISKQLADGVTILDSQSTGAGSSGWQAPEQITGNAPQTKSMDMFSLGCILFFCISGGYHPFGSRLERDHNISINNNLNLFPVEHVPEAADLIKSLLEHNPSKRPQIHTVKVHPLLWSSEKRLRFLCDTSDRVEMEERQSQSPMLKDLEDENFPVFNGSWGSVLDPVFVRDFGKHRKYNYSSIRDLLRLIRNKSSHYLELPEDVLALFGSHPDGFELYFRRKFPKLLLKVFKVMLKHCHEEERLRKYFAEDCTLQ